jgi:hypothetical protein
MPNDEISRSNIQALFRYMPEQPYNWSSRATVIGRPPRQTSALDVPEDWAKAQLLRLVRPFASAVSRGGPAPELDAIEQARFALVKAEDLQAARFPNTFLCKECNRFQVFRPGSRAECPQHGSMEQFPWAEVHECGHLKEIAAPRCSRGCRAPMALHNTRAFSTARWFWQCTQCRAKADQPIARWCGTCRNARADLIRLPQARAHYPQYVTLINPPSRNNHKALSNPMVHRAAIAQALGEVPPGIDGLRRAIAGLDASENPVAEVSRVADLLGIGPDDPMYRQLLDRAGQQSGAASRVAGPWNAAVEGLGRSREDIDAIGEECLQYSLARSASELTADELVQEFSGGPLEPQYRRYGELFARYGLRDVTLLRELPLAHIVAGYTRQSATALRSTRKGDAPVAFKFFAPGRDNRFPMYGVRTETEALLFQLDLVEITRWLSDSAVADSTGAGTQRDAQGWLLRRIDPVADLFNPPENPVSRAVLGLVHSFAHRAMKSLASRCGLNVDSLAEYLFPSQGAFLVYANTRSEFTLGGLEHVYRYDLQDALEELDAESRCVFDPPCRGFLDGAACAACLHVSEVACTRFNTVLDRNMLFGSLADSGDETDGRVSWRAYWNR